MRSTARLLIIGCRALREAVTRALPNCEVVATERMLSGVWESGKGQFDGVFLSLSNGDGALRAIRSLREVAPNTRIVVTCAPADEPLARDALRAGADDYVLEPPTRAELECALQVPPAAPQRAPSSNAHPNENELDRFAEVLQNLEQGPASTLERLTELLRQAFDAEGACVQLDDLSATAGAAADPVLEETMLRDDQVVGRVTLGRRKRGGYSAASAARLAEYARLIDVTVGQARDRRRWRELAWTDDLSGLKNRRYFDRSLDDLLARCGEQRRSLTVLLFDIDGFKAYNDRYGHETGDDLIREVAILLKRCTREHDVVARYGGDEFAVIFWDAEKQRIPGSIHPSEPVDVAKRFCKVIREHEFKCLGPDAPGPLTISGGMASYPWDAAGRAELLRAADGALMEAKRTGKNVIRLAGADASHTPAAE